MLAALLATTAALGFQGDPHAPVLVHDRDERSPAIGVSAFGFAVPGRPASEPGRAVAYRRIAAAPGGGQWRQYWLFYADNPQDRGIVRTGRHAGDWELVQYRVDVSGALREVVSAQHAGAERCGAAEIERRGGHPVVHVANGSHASYLRPGLRDRRWPDPNDEADGRGVVLRPAVQPVTARDPAWMRWPGRWGASRAAPWNPLESDSPRGPAHQPARWEDPAAFARSAGPCRAGCDRSGECDDAEATLAGGGMVLTALGLFAAVRRRRRSRRRRGSS